jgi:hypothetical protein
LPGLPGPAAAKKQRKNQYAQQPHLCEIIIKKAKDDTLSCHLANIAIAPAANLQ